MNDLIMAVEALKGHILGDTVRIGGENIPIEKVYELCKQLGEKRKYKVVDEHYYSSSSEYCELPVVKNHLIQWQTIAYYSIITKALFKEETYHSYFLDLDLLVTKDFSLIDDMHSSAVLLQTSDLPYRYVQRFEYQVLADGSYDREIDDIVNHVKKRIQQGYYVAIELDDFYVKNAAYHDALRSFIYGYDDTRCEFFCLGFLHGRFQEYKIQYYIFAKSYEYAKLVNFQAPIFLELYKANNLPENHNIEESIQDSLIKYFKSNNQYVKLQGENKKGRWQNSYEYVGYEASCKFVEILEKKIKDERIPLCYQCIHAFFENKMMLYESARHLSKISGIELLLEGKKNANSARLYFLKMEKSRKAKDLVGCVDYCKAVLECEKEFMIKNQFI